MQAVFCCRRAPGNYEFGYRQNIKDGWNFGHFRPVVIIILTVQTWRKFSWKTLLQIIGFHIMPYWKSETISHGKMRYWIFGDLSKLLSFPGFSGLSRLERKNRGPSFFFRIVCQIERCFLSPSLESWSS